MAETKTAKTVKIFSGEAAEIVASMVEEKALIAVSSGAKTFTSFKFSKGEEAIGMVVFTDNTSVSSATNTLFPTTATAVTTNHVETLDISGLTDSEACALILTATDLINSSHTHPVTASISAFNKLVTDIEVTTKNSNRVVTIKYSIDTSI